MKPQLIGAKEALNEAWKLFQASRSSFLIIGVGGQTFLALLSFLVMFSLGLGATKVQNTSTFFPAVSLLTTHSFMVFCVFLVNFVLGSIISASVILLALKTSRKEPVVWQNVFNEALKVLPGFLIVNALNSIIIFVGIILLVIPGIIFFAWFFAVNYLYLEQKIGGQAAFSASKKLVSGYTGDVLMRFFVVVVVSILISFVVSLLLAPFYSLSSVSGTLIQAVISGFTSTIYILYNYVIYKSLKEIKSMPVDSGAAATNP